LTLSLPITSKPPCPRSGKQGENRPYYHNIIDTSSERIGGSFIINRPLTSRLGLSAGVSGKAVYPASCVSPTESFFVRGGFNEIDGTVALWHQHPSGWFAS